MIKKPQKQAFAGKSRSKTRMGPDYQ